MRAVWLALLLLSPVVAQDEKIEKGTTPCRPLRPAADPALQAILKAYDFTEPEFSWQLKEMRHYAKNNVERLTTQWLLFDGELKKLKQSTRLEELMTRQGEFYDALEAEISELETLETQLQPPPEEATEKATGGTVH